MKKTVNRSSLIALLLALSLLLSSCFGLELDLGLDGIGGSSSPISLDEVPEYSGKAYIEINGNVPYFTEEEITDSAYESYADLDSLGRCGVAIACLGEELMPDDDEERGEISSVTPSGWEYDGRSNNNTYDFVSGSYVYNRCHLIGHQLTGENANEKNLVTGTRYLNIDGMLPFENMVADYIKETGNHVMYRVTPIYDGYNLVCSGVLMEGYSVEDSGEDICFCIYAYNVQPGVSINYFTGQNYISGEEPETEAGGGESSTPSDGVTIYIVTTSGKYHLSSCRYAESTKEENKSEFSGTLEELIIKYPSHEACKTCLGE